MSDEFVGVGYFVCDSKNCPENKIELIIYWRKCTIYKIFAYTK